MRPARSLPLADHLQLGRLEVTEQGQDLDHLEVVVVGDGEGPPGEPAGVGGAGGTRQRGRAYLGNGLGVGREIRRHGVDSGTHVNPRGDRLGFADGPGPAAEHGDHQHQTGQRRTADGYEDERKILGEEQPRQQEDRGHDHQQEAHQEHRPTVLEQAVDAGES
jgi:hypothetical protein